MDEKTNSYRTLLLVELRTLLLYLPYILHLNLNCTIALKRVRLHQKTQSKAVGTLPIQQIVTLRFGFEYIQYKFGGWTNLSNHVMDLTRLCFQQMSQLQHYNHISLVYFYSFPDSSYSNQGPILCFNLQNGDGSPIGYHSFAKLCEMENISLRVGRMCNPGYYTRVFLI